MHTGRISEICIIKFGELNQSEKNFKPFLLKLFLVLGWVARPTGRNMELLPYSKNFQLTIEPVYN